MTIDRSERYRTRLIGKKFGLLTVVEFYGLAAGRKTMWLCICECGGTRTARNDTLIKGSTRSCGCLTARRHDNNPNWKGYKEIGSSFWQNIQHGARKRNLEFSISMSDAWSVFIAQDKKCALTKLPLRFAEKRGDYEATASLDRIDSKKGYTLENVQWVHKKINIMKQDYDEKDFIYYCKLVAENNVV